MTNLEITKHKQRYSYKRCLNAAQNNKVYMNVEF